MATVVFWSTDRTTEITRETVVCPVARCHRDMHPVRVVYQSGTGAPGVYWQDTAHDIFSTEVQGWYPKANMRVTMRR